MNGLWKELKPNDSWFVSTRAPLQTADIGVLVNLYQPIIGAESVSLYTTLCMQSDFHTASESGLHTHRFLMGLLCMPLDQLLDARHRLEGVGLLQTFRLREQMRTQFRYETVPPLTPSSFFQSDVLSITLMNRLGKERFRQVRERYLPGSRQTPGQADEADITQPFHEAFSSFTPSELTIQDDHARQMLMTSMEAASAHSANAGGPSFSSYALDWDFLSAQAASVGSIEGLDEREKEKVHEWAFFYQLGDVELGRALQNPGIYDEQNHLIPEKLHEYIKQEYRFRFGHAPDIRHKERRLQDSPVSLDSEQTEARHPEEAHRMWLATISPLELLERYQRGGKVPQADVQLVETLYEQYGLLPPVINVLIEFVLLTNDYKLPRALVEKMAGHWKRANVKTVEAAQELALRQWQRPQGKEMSGKRTGKQAHNRRTSAGKRAKPTPTKKEAPERPEPTEAEQREWQNQFDHLLAQLRQGKTEEHDR